MSEANMVGSENANENHVAEKVAYLPGIQKFNIHFNLVN